eukprot:comp19908_c0_seq1/m.24137 comp19908_c0_seq1/g.24137  ORF comp19908_c0_seq1/g.24137 comp19908_c0_seq1/m.24137 type:complete len:620 (-) comp19908_c0_seq1:708-2567(-)
MLIPKAEFRTIYKEVKKDALRTQGTSVLIFAALNTDAVCACKMLTNALQHDYIKYNVLPVVGYDDMSSAIRDYMDEDTLRSVFLLNCGGGLDLLEHFSESLGEDIDIRERDVKFYVFDSNRPLNLTNVHDDAQIHIFYDDDIEPLDSFPSADEIQTIKAWDEGTLTLSDDEQSDDDDARESPTKRRKTERPKTRAERLQELEEIRDRVLYYYGSGTSYAVASSLLLYDLMEALNKKSNDMLWPAILGLTDQFLHEQIDRERYTELVFSLKSKVASINREEGEENRDEQAPLREEGSQITFQEDFRFMAMRHWSLYESMFYSTYVATHLRIWTEQGVSKLNILLTRMGMPLQQCKEKYNIMSPTVKKKLKDKLMAHASECGLNTDHLLFGTFCRKLPFQTPLAASDAVYAMTALLERPPSQPLGVADAGNGANGANRSGQEVEVDPDDVMRAWMKANFYTALDTLAGQSSIRMLQKGLEFSMEQQRAMIMQVKAILEQKAVTMAKGFRHCRTCGDYAVFGSPLILTRLALFLYDIYKERKSGATPFVVASQVEKSDTYLVVGITGSKFGQVTKNPFGHAFRRAAEKTKARFRHDSFATNVIEISTADYMQFLLSLSHIFR